MRAIALVALLATTQAYADATATANITNRTPAIFTSGGTSTEVSGTGVLVSPGESVSFSFDYTLSVSDDGLPFQVTEDGTNAGPSAVFVGTGGPLLANFRLHGTEFAVASIYFDNPCFARGFSSGGCPPGVTFSATSDLLATFADDLPQSFTRSGHGSFIFGMDMTAMEPMSVSLLGPRTDVVALGQTASPAPEPSTWVLMALGLALCAAQNSKNRHRRHDGRRDDIAH